MREGHNEAKHTRALIGYWDSNGNFIPLSVVHHLPADTNFSNVLTISAVQVSPTGAFELPNRFASLTTVEDYIRMFDGKLDTYAIWHFYNGSAGNTDSVYIWFGGESFIIKEVLIYYDIEEGDISNLSFVATDLDGNTYDLTATTSTIDILGITRNVLTLTDFPDTNIVQIEIKHTTGANIYTKLLVRELRVYLKQVTRGNMGVDINSSEIMVPSDIQAIYRPVVAETTATLGVNGTYASSTFDAENYKQLVYIIYSDQDGDLYIDESMDGTHWDYTEHIPYTGGSGKVGTVKIHSRYVRVFYVNGSTAQSEFRLSVRAEVV